RAMGREKFIERVWQWKEESGNTIVGQLKLLGCSCDWSRLRFTMDEGLSRAVRKFIVVATTRPETMLGDTAVAVHPDDERYKHLVGKNVTLPLVGRRIPIIADEYSDPEKGSGAVKITPAHDFNDFEVGKRHKLPQINVLNREGKIRDYEKQLSSSAEEDLLNRARGSVAVRDAEDA